MWKIKTLISAINLVKRQFLFLMLFLVAATALIWIKKQDQSYHETKEKPFEIVGDEKTARLYKYRYSVTKIRDVIANNDPEIKKRQMNVLELALIDLKAREMKDVGDLTSRLKEKLILQRKNRRDFLRGRINDADIDSIDDKTRVLLEYRDRTRGETHTEIETLLSDLRGAEKLSVLKGTEKATPESSIRIGRPSSFSARAELIKVLERIKPGHDSAVPKEELFKEISREFGQEKFEDAVAGYKSEIADLSKTYDPVFNQISDSGGRLKKLLTLPAIWSGIADSILGHDGELNILYRFGNIILTFIVVFTLLFVIIQPLTRIFFLSGHTDVLRQRLQDSLKIGKSVSLPQTAITTAVAGISAVGIGAVAVTGGQFDHAKPVEKPAPVVSTIMPAGYGGDRNMSSAIRDVASSVRSLDDRVSKIDIRPNGGTTILELSPVERALGKIGSNLKSPPDYSPALKEMLDRIGSDQTAAPDSSLFGKINNFDSKFDRVVGNDFSQTDDGSVVGGLLRLKKNIGDPAQTTKDSPAGRTVFRDLRTVSERVDSLSAKVGDSDGSNGTETLFGRIGNPKDPNSANTVFGRTKAVKQVADNIDEYSSDIWRSQAGRNGRNVVTQAKILIRSEQYAVSVVALREIKRELKRQRFFEEANLNTKRKRENFAREERLLDQLVDQLTAMMKSGNAMKRSGLARRLIAASDKKTWKKHRGLIMRFTRVSRY